MQISTPFSKGQTIGFDRTPSAEIPGERSGALRIGENTRLGGGNAVLFHKGLRKRLGRITSYNVCYTKLLRCSAVNRLIFFAIRQTPYIRFYIRTIYGFSKIAMDAVG